MKPDLCSFYSIPVLQKAKSILCIQPHPDDMEIGAGATLALLIKNGVEVTCLTVTDGGTGSEDPGLTSEDICKIRRKESEQSARLLGVKKLLWLDFPDGGDLPYEIVRGEITRVIRTVKPEALLVCDPWLPYEVHSDHVRTGKAAAEAAFLANMPNFCPADLLDGFSPHSVKMIAFYYTAWPNTYIDVSQTWNLKMEAISCHSSQFSHTRLSEMQDFLKAKAMSYNTDNVAANSPVEAFKVLSPSHLHILECAWQC